MPLWSYRIFLGLNSESKAYYPEFAIDSFNLCSYHGGAICLLIQNSAQSLLMSQTSTETETKNNLLTRLPTSFWISWGLFLLALAVRLPYALQINWPPLDDPAYYIQAARSLYYHQNLDISIIWNFNPRFPTVTHAGMEFWQPLSSYVIAISFIFLGDNLFAAQFPSIIAGSLLSPMAYWFARRLNLDRPNIVGGLAGLLLVFSPLLAYQSILPDSSMLYSALIAGALLLLTRPQNEFLTPGKAILFGLLTGLAYLTRTPAIFLILSWLILLLPRFRYGQGQLWQYRNRVEDYVKLVPSRNLPNWLEILWAGGVMATLGGLWAFRNLQTYGYITSPAGTQTIFLFDYNSLFNYTNPVSFQTMLEGGFGKILGIRLEALWSAMRTVLDLIFVPTVIPAVIGLALLAKHSLPARPATLYSLFLFLGLPLIFGVASINGSYYHSAGSCAPFLAVGLVYGFQEFAVWLNKRVKIRRRIIFRTLVTFFLVLCCVWLGEGVSSITQGHRDEGALYAQVNSWLRANPSPVVIASQPASINYVSGVAAVRLPSTQDLEVLRQVAQQYGAKYIIITEQGGLYPDLLQSPKNTHFPLAYRSPSGDLEIYRVGE